MGCEENMEGLPEELQTHIHDFRPVRSCAKMVADFMSRIAYNDEEGITLCLQDYRLDVCRASRLFAYMAEVCGRFDRWRVHGGL